MSKLIVTDGNEVIQTVDMTPERLTIGRHPDNALQLHDKAVSGHHAVIVTIMSESFLEDLDSTNGTLVNGKRIAKHPLSHGDTITMGGHTLKYESDVQIDEDALEQTMILRPGELAGQSSGGGETLASVASQPAAAKPTQGLLTLASGAHAGRAMKLTKALTTIGKPGVSVAAVTRRPNGYYIVQVGGARDADTAPVVNDEPIGSRARQLADGDTIRLAGTELRFTLTAAD